MKKFTFLFAFLILSAAGIAQSNPNLQSKIQKLQERYTHYSKLTATLRSNSKILTDETHSILKSAQAVQSLDSIIYQDYDSETESWVNVWKDSYQYNSELANTAWIEEEWDESSSAWVEYGWTEFEYNESGLVSEMIMYGTDGTTGELVPEYRTNAFYDSEGRLDSVMHYYTDDGETWIDEVRQVYLYNDAGKLVQMELTAWEEYEGIEYLETMIFYYTYDSQGRMESSNIVFIDEEMEIPFSETLYFYDSSGRRNASEYSSINFFTFILEKFSRTEYEYNASDDVSVETTSLWDEDQEDWVLDEKNEYTYSDISFSDVIFPSYLQFWGINEEVNQFNNAITEIDTYYLIDGNWSNTEKTIFYYSEGTPTDVPQIAEAQVSVYPNPFADAVTFTWSGYNLLSLEIYNISGAKIMDRQVYPGLEISAYSLNKGIYLYRLLNGHQTIHSGKLIKK